jgi:hypothetical protein
LRGIEQRTPDAGCQLSVVGGLSKARGKLDLLGCRFKNPPQSPFKKGGGSWFYLFKKGDRRDFYKILPKIEL